MLLPLAALVVTHLFYPLWRPSVVKVAAEFSPARAALLKHALTWTDPVKLDKMAAAFEKEGCHDEAEKLRARAQLRSHPGPTLDTWQQVIKKALTSKNTSAIRDVAKAFGENGATSIEDLLTQYAVGLETLNKIAPVVVPAQSLSHPPTTDLPPDGMFPPDMPPPPGASAPMPVPGLTDVMPSPINKPDGTIGLPGVDAVPPLGTVA
jgi:hypothetical protein